MNGPRITFMPPMIYGHADGATITRETPCPECGKPMVYRGVWKQEHPGLVDPVDISDWRWVVSYVRTLIDCQCLHTLNVERWEMHRAMADVTDPWQPTPLHVYVCAAVEEDRPGPSAIWVASSRRIHSRTARRESNASVSTKSRSWSLRPARRSASRVHGYSARTASRSRLR